MKTFTLPLNLRLRHKNSHDVEDPLLVETLKRELDDVSTFLDVGANFSYHHYAHEVANLLGESRIYLAVDFLHCPKTEALVTDYIVGDINEEIAGKADFVSSISVLEHCGVNVKFDPSLPEKAQKEDLLKKTFQKILNLSRRFFFVTFPVGLPGGNSGEYENITEAKFSMMEGLAKVSGFSTEGIGFFFNPFSQRGDPWVEVSRKRAFDTPYDPQVDVQSIAVWFGKRGL